MLPAIALGSIGVAGVGGGGTFAALIVLSTLNFPVALVGIFIAIEPVVDMARTALNVNGSMMSGVLANRLLKRVLKTTTRERELVSPKKIKAFLLLEGFLCVN